MTPHSQTMLAQLVALFPGFLAAWEVSYFRQNDPTKDTVHGVCSEFSGYYQNNNTEFSNQQLNELFSLVENYVASDPLDEQAPANALCTCFLENIAGTESAPRARLFMGPISRAFFNEWDSTSGLCGKSGDKGAQPE